MNPRVWRDVTAERRRQARVRAVEIATRRAEWDADVEAALRLVKQPVADVAALRPGGAG